MSVTARTLAGEKGIEEAIVLLRRGEVVGLPTETVYGLAGDAFNPLAIARIFEAKGRPLTDPLIVHLPEAGWLSRVACFESSKEQQRVEQLAAAFWPGPLTLILKKHPDLPDLVTAGAESVAVRVTAHPVFAEVLRRIDAPLAAPSANRFGRISPTTAEAVHAELHGTIALIVDGGACEHGMESTIVAVHGETLEILRPGPITREQLAKYGSVSLSGKIANTPGSMPGHYAPKKKLSILEMPLTDFSPDSKTALLAFLTPLKEVASRYAALEILSPLHPEGDLREAAANFYGALRRLDESGTEKIVAEPLPEFGIGVAIMDRLRRASYGSQHRSLSGHE